MNLHLGCGKRNFGAGWTHIDGGTFPHINYHDLVDLPFADNTIELVYASHVLEYWDWQEAASLVLPEWRRVLVPNGILRLAVPDFTVMAKLYTDGVYPLDNFIGPLYGRMPLNDKLIYHKSVYDSLKLQQLLSMVGFSTIRPWDWRGVDHGKFDDCSQAYLPHMDKENGVLISLNMEAVK